MSDTDRTDGGGARLAPVMPPATVLRGYVGMWVVAVHDHPAGLVIELCPRGHMARQARRVFIEGALSVTDITVDRSRWSQADDDQAQIDIGDDKYEREREDRE